MPLLVESLSNLAPDRFTLFLLQLSWVENDEENCRSLPRLFIENLLKFCWGEAAEGEEREIPVQRILALPEEDLVEVLSQVPMVSKEEMLALLNG